MSLEVAYSTVAAEAIAHVVAMDYGVGPITSCYLLQRGYNDVYELEGGGGTKYIARVSGRRPRGPANIAYETALLTHLKARGLHVACALAATDGRLWRELDAPEGPRTFAVFEHLAGSSLPVGGSKLVEAIDDVKLLGAELARLHAAGESYAGPPSLYRQDGDHLLAGPIGQLLAAPLDEALRNSVSEIGASLGARLAEVAPRLSCVACHGDNHGGNTVMSGAPGQRIAAWFDFDDSGPGFLAYDLSVFLWQLLSGRAALSDQGRAVWAAFVHGYRANRSIADADFEAIALFVPIRHILWVGERAGRIPQWGVRSMSDAWLGPQLAMVRSWDSLVTPPV
jgi:Ser/Thr protein kinase RdoA (MazF antagonist)